MRKLLYGPALRIAVSLVLATTLWVFVSFTENPQQSTPLTNLPIQAEGLGAGLTLVDGGGAPIAAPDAVVNLTAVGARDVLSRFGKQNVQPYINLAGLGPGAYQLTVESRAVPAGTDVAFRSIQPAQIAVDIQPIITATVPLTISISGQPPTSFEAGLPRVYANGAPIASVTVRGPAAQVRRVAGGEVSIDLSGQASNLNIRRQLVPIDAAGREIEGVSITPSEARIEIDILSSSGIKRVPIIYVVRDQPPAGLRPLITLNPAFVTLIGSSQVLGQVDFVETQPIDLFGATSDFTTTVKLRFPSGVTPRDAQAAEMTVAQVRLVPIETPFNLNLPVSVRNLPPGMTAVLEPNLLEVHLKGTLTPGQNPSGLALILDLAGQRAGTYSLVPTLALPGTLSLAEPIRPVTVTLAAFTPTPGPPTATPASAAPAPPTPTAEASTPTSATQVAPVSPSPPATPVGAPVPTAAPTIAPTAPPASPTPASGPPATATP